jgi:hypothetical protein
VKQIQARPAGASMGRRTSRAQETGVFFFGSVFFRGKENERSLKKGTRNDGTVNFEELACQFYFLEVSLP